MASIAPSSPQALIIDRTVFSHPKGLSTLAGAGLMLPLKLGCIVIPWLAWPIAEASQPDDVV